MRRTLVMTLDQSKSHHHRKVKFEIMTTAGLSRNGRCYESGTNARKACVGAYSFGEAV